MVRNRIKVEKKPITILRRKILSMTIVLLDLSRSEF